jgi:hypothetical protein
MHDPWLVFIPEHPLFSNELRGDPRYLRTLERVGLSRRFEYGT